MYIFRVLLEGLRSYAETPEKIGKTFLRLERDFDKHSKYSKLEKDAQNFLKDCEEARTYFEVRTFFQTEIHS